MRDSKVCAPVSLMTVDPAQWTMPRCGVDMDLSVEKLSKINELVTH